MPLEQAKELAKVPKYHAKDQDNNNPSQKLIKRKVKLETNSKHPNVTLKDQESMRKEIAEINSKMQENYDDERERKEREAVEKISLNPKEFFKYANKTKKAKSKIGPLKEGKKYYSGPKEMARILSEQYRSVFSKPKNNYDNIQFARRAIASMEEIVLTKEMFVVEMWTMNTSAAPGPDGAPAYLYRKFAEELVDPIFIIWKHSIDAGVMPEKTLLAYITPILKAVDRSLPVNYRPVSLTNHLTKIFERVLRRQIVGHLDAQGLMNKTQHGFRSRFSTITQILTYYDSVLTMLEEGCPVDAIYLDFSKAFDKVDHRILMKKLESLGITGKLLKWIEVFLTNRQQQVRIGDVLSEREWVKSGVPHGSVLGPLLFLIMVIDIDVIYVILIMRMLNIQC